MNRKSMPLLPAVLSCIGLVCAYPGHAQVADATNGMVAGIPVNYTEAKVGTYHLPDPLTLAIGQPVRDRQTWFEGRRPELLALFEEHQYGRCPVRPADMTFDVFDKATPAFDGKAVRRQVTIHFTKDKAGPFMDLLIYLPACATNPVPLLLNANFSANNLAVDDPGVKVGRNWDPKEKKYAPSAEGRRFGRLSVLPLLEKGFGVATLHYTDIEPDALGAVAAGIRGAYLKPGQSNPAPDEWGAIAAWSWGLSRALDYFETDRDIDAKHVALFGVSRLGKTVLWTAARDPRFALVIASCSGEGGAALSRRNYGETIAHLVAPTRYPYQFCSNYAKFAQQVDQLPVDAHLLLALVAPRPVLLQTGDTDRWSDPKGEFEAAVAAEPVFKLLGGTGLDTTNLPAAGQPLLHTLGYYMHSGGHGAMPSDWEVFLKFLQMYLK
jgi:hypothetical protein